MSGWEDQDPFGGKKAPSGGNTDPFGDEDESSEEDWDAPKKMPAKSSKPKTKLELAIEAREIREQRLQAKSVLDEEIEGEDSATRKARLEKAAQEADKMAAMDAFGVADEGSTPRPAGSGDDAEFEPMNPHATLDSMLPDTEAEFDIFLEKLLGRIKLGEDSEDVMDFVKSITNRVTAHLKGFEMKPLLAHVTAIHAAKLQEQRDADGKKAKVNKSNTKAAVGKNSRLNKKNQHKSGTDGDIRYDKYEDGYGHYADKYG
jgi:hypothetical protein